jgi:hypothetical protein
MKIHNELEMLYNDEKLNKLKWMMFINEKYKYFVYLFTFFIKKK